MRPHLHAPLARVLPLALMMGLLLAACSDPVPLYEVQPQQVTQQGIDKRGVKSEIEFISVVYADLFGRAIAQADLTELGEIYQSFGDKALITDLIVRNMLNDPQAQVPDDATMRADPEAFVLATYQTFYLRQPSEYERWYFVNRIRQDGDLTAQEVYMAFLTSAEYTTY